ncbi:GSCFA domain-containing protein [Algibacter sp. PT7-4]|uniref:GSCFA domain-containing protein n=1 Tax=Algibacter ulvanivorans TaxID=3400999 RepID=UPI003AB0B239
MNLLTKIPLKKQDNNLIDYNSEILFLGSCFSENIGGKFNYFKFKNTINPFGILFHPVAIENLILKAIEEDCFSEKDVFNHNEKWHCFKVHSKLSNTSKKELVSHLNKQKDVLALKLKTASHIIITLGTSWVYRNTQTQDIVANCHKVPQKQFKKELLTVQAITKSLKSILSLISGVNKNASVIFTVSPIRHTKDGFIENTQSKSHLITAIHQVLNKQSFYFPSFEIMMDELRDYRFYKQDMIHPNTTAINYIWNAFKLVWLSNHAFKMMETIETIQKGLQHKPFNAKSQAHQRFLKNLEVKKATLQAQFSHIVF